jgi:hypothetical protein
MKMVAEYMEHAGQCERLANAEQDPVFKAILTEQAMNYRKLANERIDRLNLPLLAAEAQPEARHCAS